MTRLLACLLLSLAAAAAAAAPPRAFDENTLADLRRQLRGSPFILALWSVHCAPCREELPRLRDLARRYPAVPVVFVAADPPEAHGAVERMWTALAMGETPGWAFAHDYLERLRWHIDPDWYGELPRTYFHDARHEARAHSGVIDHQSTARWMSAVSPAP
ncbi:MAG: redoxin domain-containing protein [Rhodocyclaceae bacterium]|nr:redoxin domain-containing protein [Rhodocyclaceae bacterium]